MSFDNGKGRKPLMSNVSITMCKIYLILEDFSEDLLTQHENALEAVKQFYTENELILKKIERRWVTVFVSDSDLTYHVFQMSYCSKNVVKRHHEN